MKATTEKAFEAYTEETLLERGWNPVSNEHWDKKLALYPSIAINFIQSTQPDTYNQMTKLHGNGRKTCRNALQGT
jgi:hypothetical protein